MSAQAVAPFPIPSRVARNAWRPTADAVARHASECERCRSRAHCSEYDALDAIEREAWTAYRATWGRS